MVVLGCSGAGKSRLAAALSARTGIPAVHLDLLFWDPGWALAPQEVARRRLDDAVAGDRWILDGEFLKAGDDRFARANAVVFLDRSRWTCLVRVVKRALLERDRKRPDLPAGCAESIDLALLGWIWRYPRDERPRVLALLEEFGARVEVHHLRSNRDVARFLATL